MTDNRSMANQSGDAGIDSLLSEDATVPEFSPGHRHVLEVARTSLSQDGFYAYLMVDDLQRWCVAADDEAGRVDVRLEQRRYVVEVCGSSPGLFMEEDSAWRRQALERLARRAVPNVARGILDAHQSAQWSEEDRGVTVCVSREVSLDHPEEISAVARRSLLELDDLLTLVESQLRS